MRAFVFRIEDIRLPVPTLAIVLAKNDLAARDLARKRLESSPHHRSIEVSDRGRLLLRIERAEAPADGLRD